MNQYLYHFRQKRFSLKEKRLLGLQIRTPEILKEASDVLAELKKEIPDSNVVQASADSVEENQRNKFIDQVRAGLSTLDPQIKALASNNLVTLAKATTSNNLKALKLAVEADAGAGKEKKEDEIGFMAKAGDSMEEVADSVLPKKWAESMSRNQKIAFTGITGVAAAALVYQGLRWLFGRGKKSVEAGKEAAKASSGGFLQKLAIGLGIGALAFGSYKAYEMYKEVGSIGGMIAKMQEEAMKSISAATAAAKKTASDAANSTKEFLGLLKPWEKYKLTEEDYKNAVAAPDTKPQNIAKNEIRKIFGLKNGETSPEYEEFMQEMKVNNEVYEIDGITYTGAERSQRKCESFFESVYGEIADWVELHPVETAVGGFFAIKYGILQKALQVSGSAFKKCIAIGRALLRFGVRHPLVSLLLAGGAIGAIFASKKQLQGALAPADMSEFAKALVDGKPIFINAETKAPIDNLSANIMGSFSEGTSEALKDFDNLVSNLAGATVEMLGQIWEKIPQAIQINEFEFIVSKNGDGFDELWSSLEKQERTLRSKKNIDERMYNNLSAIRIALSQFESTFFAGITDTGFQPSEDSVQMYSHFVKAMEDAGFTVQIIDDIVQYRLKDSDENIHLCMNPNIKDVDKAVQASANLIDSDSAFSQYWQAALMEFRTYQKGDNIFYMYFGNGFFAWDPAYPSRYLTLQIDAFQELLGEGFNSAEFGKAAGLAAGATGIIALSTIPPTLLKRYLVGGGRPIGPGRFGSFGKWFNRAANIAPGVYPAKLVSRGHRALRDIQEYGHLIKEYTKGGMAVDEARDTAKLVVTALGHQRISGGEIRRVIQGSYWQRKLTLQYLCFKDPSLRFLQAELESAQKAGNGFDAFNTSAIAAMDSALGKIPGTEVTRRALDMILRISRADYIKRSVDMLNSGGSVEKLFKMGSYADEIFDAAAASKDLRHLDEFVAAIESMEDANRLKHMTRLCEKIPIDDLKSIGFVLDDIVLGVKNIAPADKAAFIIKASKIYGANRLVTAGFSAEELHTILSGVPAGVVDARVLAEADGLVRLARAQVAADIVALKAGLDPKALKTLDALMQDDFFVKLLKESGKTSDEAMAFMKNFDNLDADTLIRLKESGGARKLLAGGIKTGNQAEVDHIIKIANRAAKIRVLVNAAGVVGDLFCVYMMFEDLKANNMRIQETNNPQLKLLYQQADLLYYAEGGSGAAGLMLYGVAVYSSATAGAGVITALGAPAGLILLPIAALTYGARVTYTALEASAEYHTLTEADLVGFSSGKILQHINSTDTNTRLNFSQTLAEWVPTDSWTQWGGEYNPDDANLGARHEGYRAYYALIAQSVLPSPTVLDLDMSAEEIQAMPPEEIQSRLKIYQQDMNSRFVFDALSYIAFKTEKSFEGVSPELLNTAQLYATQQYKTRKNNPEAPIPYRPWNDSAAWRSVEAGIQEEKSEHMSALENQLIDFSANPKQFEASAPSIFLDLLQHDLATFEMKVLHTDYSGVADDWEQNVARGYAAWKIREVFSIIVKDVVRGTINTGHIRQVLIDCRSILTENPDTYALAGANSKHAGFYHFRGSNEYALTSSERGIPSLLHEYPIIALKKASVDVKSPTPINALRFHSGSTNQVELSMEQEGGVHGAFLSGMTGYSIQKIDGVGAKFTYGGDVAQLPNSGTYYFWKPGNTTTRPDLKIIFHKVDKKVVVGSLAEARDVIAERNGPDMIRVAGNELLSKKQYISLESTDSYSIQFGQVFNKYLYMRFSGSEWVVSIGGSEGPWHGTSSYRAKGFSDAVTKKYNDIIKQLDDINRK